MINLSGCIVLPPGVAKIFQIRKIQRLQLFPMTPYIVLVEIKVVRNYVMNNFKLHDQLSRINSFHSKNLWSWQNSTILQKKSFFGQL